MKDFFEFIVNYWYIIFAGIAAVSVISIKVYNWLKQPSTKQLEQIRQWLLYAVMKAEQELGSGTGQLKLRYVYNMFLAKFPAIALFISFDNFSQMVDEALEELRDLINGNDNIKQLIEPNDIEGGQG